MGIKINAVGKDFNMDSLPEVQKFIKAEVEHSIDEVITQDDIESMLVSAIANRIRKSLDPVVSSYKSEVEGLKGEIMILRKTSHHTERLVTEALLNVENMNEELADLQNKIEGTFKYANKINKVGDFAQNLSVALAAALDIQPQQTKEKL